MERRLLPITLKQIDPHDRFVLRIWPRACQISKGIAGLRFLLKGNNKHQLDLHVSQMKYTGLNDVVDQL